MDVVDQTQQQETSLLSNQSEAPPQKDTPVEKKDTPAPDWRSALPEDVRDLPEIKKYKDVGELAKGHVNQSKLVGNSVRVPGADAKPEEWDAFYAKTGRPENADKYEIGIPDNIKPLVNEERMAEFRKMAFANGLTSKQVAAIVAYQGANIAADLGAVDAGYKATVDTLKAEWGGAFERNLGVAKRFVKEIGGGKLEAALVASRFDNNLDMVKAFHKAGMMLIEDGVMSGDFEGMAGPTQAKEQIAAIMGDKAHAYWDAASPEHKSALEKMKTLHELAYPNE
jgi:hypothetical protein